MNIKDITDRVFEYLDDKIYLTIVEKWNELGKAGKKSTVTDSNPNRQVEIHNLIRRQHNDQIVTFIRPLLENQLKAIVPEAGFWFSGSPPPGTTLKWVVSPWQNEPMASGIVSVALQKGDELLMGILANLSRIRVATAAQGSGAHEENTALKVNERLLTSQSSNVQCFIEKRITETPYAPLVRVLRHTYNIPVQVNTVASNISVFNTDVARGELDFSMGYHFHYPDIAASVCIAEQAGGVVTDFSGGKEKLLGGEEFFCSNPLIHRQFMELAKQL
ncbi:inositol monophosphatase family protein [Agriterribacter sp.]|uniref:inositol monophosphatase family protein n=1 Tax=Agriterribacter sp. TaxID=2821509 RepID=UPI002CFFA52F|nr:inositol monophosphatase family protein [Agriterribacter sp.]HRP55541.1 inositol monophosphatase family protein [Agriterribacter sp.]